MLEFYPAMSVNFSLLPFEIAQNSKKLFIFSVVRYIIERMKFTQITVKAGLAGRDGA